METSASFEARYAPLPYPTNHVVLAIHLSGEGVGLFAGLYGNNRMFNPRRPLP